MTIDAAQKRRATIFVLLTVFIYSVGFGIIMPVLPKLIMELENVTLAEATSLGGWIGATYSILMFLCGPIMGNFGDRFGRRPVFLISLFAFGLDFLLMGLAPSIIWLFIGRGIAGSLGAVFGPANAAMADLSSPEERAASFGKVGAAFGIGFIVGPAIGGIIADFGVRVPFFVAGGLALANALFGFFAFPETMPKESQRPFNFKRANPVGALLNIGKIPAILPVAFIYFLWQWAGQVYPASWSFFALAQYGWDTKMVGVSLTVVGISMVTVQALVLGRAVKRFGERNIATFSISFAIIGFTVMAFVTNGMIALILSLIMGLQGMAMPALNALMSRRTPVDQQGEVQGLISSMAALSLLLAQILFNSMLSYFSGPDAPLYFPGAIFLAAAFIALLALIALWRLPPAKQEQS